MLYNILAIIIGIFILLNFILTLLSSKKDSKMVDLFNLCSSILFLGMGIGGFFIPKDFEYITIIVLLVLSILYLLFFLYQSKKTKKSQKTKEDARS